MHRLCAPLLGAALLALVLSGPVLATDAASSCAGVQPFQWGYETAQGWRAVKLAHNLTLPRGVAVDSEGNLLVVQKGRGLSAYSFGPDGCISASKDLIENPSLNHGISLTPDGNTLYVSSSTTAWSYAYDAETRTVGQPTVVVRNMNNGGHSTRALLVPPATPDLLLIQHGSLSNLDYESVNKTVGRAVIKVFDMRKVPASGYNYASEGWFLGYGLRNTVGFLADGNNDIWGLDNGGDQFVRTINGQSTDIHVDNPSDELNCLGNPSTPNERWYGYPFCHAVWDAASIVDRPFQTGEQFVLTPNNTFNDDTCSHLSLPPRLSIQAHSAPVGAVFDRDFKNLYMTLHGSWNRANATGYKVSVVPFTQLPNGRYEPVAGPESRTGYSDIFWSTNVGNCTKATCYRPSGITWDRSFSRLYVASDNIAVGELFMLIKE